MGNILRRLSFAAAVLVLLGVLSGCNQLRNARPITDVNQLDGQRVGVALSWAPDYLLSDREDMTLVRYNTIADMVTALCFQRVDAISVEQPLVPMILQSVEGVRCIPEPLINDGITCLISPEREDILEEFNDFIAEFKTTPEYEDLSNRLKDMDGFVPSPVPEAEGGRTLKLCVADDSYPFSYINFETGEYEGIDVEIIQWFAYRYGYDLEISGGTWEAMDMGVCSGRYDIGVGGVSDLYRGDYEMAGLCFVSEVYLDMDILFIEIEDPEKLAIVAAIEE